MRFTQKNLNMISITFIFLLNVLIFGSAQSSSLFLNNNPQSVKKPAVNLLDSSGNVLNLGHLIQMTEAGYDHSVLNPIEDNIWSPTGVKNLDLKNTLFPTDHSVVKFIGTEAKNRFTYMAKVVAKDNPHNFYRLTMSRLTHGSLMRASLMRKLGYLVPPTRIYKSLTIEFSDNEEMNSFILESEGTVIDVFEDSHWILNKDETNHQLTLSLAVLEPSQTEIPDLHWGFLPNPAIPSHRNILQNLSLYRSFRSFIVPLVITELPESINRFSPKSASVQKGNIVLTHESASAFAASDIFDGKWITRKISQLSINDLKDIVKDGEFPSEIAPLILEILKSRINNMIEVFGLDSNKDFSNFNVKITSTSGLVKNGKVTQERIEGSPLRWSHGDRPSPFGEGDVGRFISIESMSSTIKQVLENVNKELVFKDMGDAAIKHQKDVINDVIKHFRKNPTQPYEQKISSWGGPTASLNVNSSRHISTGTYYESQAPIQLVDTFNFGGSVGYFRALDGLGSVDTSLAGTFPVLGANLTLNRSYVHVRPIDSVKEGYDVEWNKLLLPSLFTKIGQNLSVESGQQTDCQANPDSNSSHVILETSNPLNASQLQDDNENVCAPSIDKFLGELKSGEVFTVTDSLTFGGFANISSPLDILLGLSPIGFANSISLGIDAQKSYVLNQTSFVKTDSGLQVFIRSAKTSGYGVQFDFNYFINILRIRHQSLNNDLYTNAYVLNYEPGVKDSNNQDVSKKLSSSLSAVLLHNDPSLLEGYFKDRRFKLKHEIKNTEKQLKFLTRRMIQFEEGHKLELTYPSNPKLPDLNPEDSIKTLYSFKKGHLVGRNLVEFFSDLLDGFLKKSSYLSLSNSPNPANSPFGKAHWKLITSEADLSDNGTPIPPISMIQDVWGGWKIKRKDFINLISNLSKKFSEMGVEKYRLIEPEAFSNVQSVDFYRISSNLVLSSGGIDKVKQLLMQPENEDDKRWSTYSKTQKRLSRFFSRLSEVIGKINSKDSYDGKYLSSDTGFFQELLEVIGDGNKEVGKMIYDSNCEESYQKQNGGYEAPMFNSGSWWYGTYYDCLSPWVLELIQLKRSFKNLNEYQKVQWATRVLWTLSENIPLPTILKLIGRENYIYFVRVNGFRTGDEDGDLEFFSNSSGDPIEDMPQMSGIFQLYAKKTGIMPLELDRTLGSFR